MGYYKLLLFAYTVIFSAANIIPAAANFLFAKISRFSLKRRLKRTELTPLESAYLVFKEFPDELGAFIEKRTKMFSTFAFIYFIAIEFADFVGLYYSKDSVIVCRISIALAALLSVLLIVFGTIYISKAKKMNKKVVEQIEQYKTECAEVLQRAMNSTADTVEDLTYDSEEIRQGKEFLKYAVSNQLINEVIPEEYFESPLS